MFFIPRRADFWRPWLALAVLAGLSLIAAWPGCAHAAGGRHHHTHHLHRLHHLPKRASPAGGRHVARGGDPVAIAMRFIGHGNPTGTHRAWCGDFVNMTERLASRPGLASGGLASAWQAYGHASAPVRGAIAVMRSHVSRVVERVGSAVWLISGNWSHRVKIHRARLRDVLAFRRA